MAKRSLTERLVRRVYYKYFARNILYELQIRARSESADYVQTHMPEALIFEQPEALLRWCVKRAPAGAILEFGVAGGASITVLANTVPGDTVHGFDSFEGLPEDWSGHVEGRGAFSQGGRLPKVPGNAVLHKGWFDDTLPRWRAAHPDALVGFLHVDCDLYGSTRVILWGLADRLQKGTVIKFDEYFNYPNWQHHEYKAWQEFVAEFGLSYRYLAFTAHDGRVAVEITDTGRLPAARNSQQMAVTL